MALFSYGRLKILLYVFVFMLCGCSNGQMLLEGQHQEFACYGNHPQYSFINASCPSGSVIAPGIVEYGAKLRNLTNCTGNIEENKMIDYYNLCCKPDTADKNTDCLQEQKIDSPYENCTGRPMCRFKADWAQISNTKCNIGSYGSSFAISYTSYVIFNFFCVEGTRIYSVNSVNTTINASMVYLWNTGYPNQIQANTKSACSIELEKCSANIPIKNVHVNLSMISNEICNQTIRFRTSNFEVVKTLSCAVDRNISYIYTSSDTYLYIETENLSGNQGGYFWLGFQASESTTFHVHCPGRNRTYCIPATTISAPTSTTAMTNLTTIATSTTTASTTTTMMTTERTLTPSTATATTKTTASSTSGSIDTSHPTSPIATSPVDNSDSKIGIIIGVVVGAVALVTIIITSCCIWQKLKQRGKRNKEKNMFQMESESNPSQLQLETEVAPINHSVVTNTVEEPNCKEYDEKRKRKKENKKRRKKDKMRHKRMETAKDVQPDFQSVQGERDKTIEGQSPFSSGTPQNDAQIHSVYSTEMDQTGGGNKERDKRKKEKRRKKKKKKDKDNHVYNNIVLTADSNQPDLQVGHTEGGNAWKSQSIAPLDIRDKTNTMGREDPVPDDAEKRHRKRKKHRSERFKGKDAGQTEDGNNPDSRERRKKKRKKHTRKEYKRQSDDVVERLPSFEEDMHNFKNNVYPSSDSY